MWARLLSISEVHIVSIFRVEVSRVGEYPCIYSFWANSLKGGKGIPAKSGPMWTVDRKIVSKVLLNFVNDK
jgi:hypothetical protein